MSLEVAGTLVMTDSSLDKDPEVKGSLDKGTEVKGSLGT